MLPLSNPTDVMPSSTAANSLRNARDGDEVRAAKRLRRTDEVQSTAISCLPRLPPELLDDVFARLEIDEAARVRHVDKEWLGAFYRHAWWKRGGIEGPRAREALASLRSRGDVPMEELMFRHDVIVAQLQDWVDKEVAAGSKDAPAIRDDFLATVRPDWHPLLGNRERYTKSGTPRSGFIGQDVYSYPACFPWMFWKYTNMHARDCLNLKQFSPEIPSSCGRVEYRFQVYDCPNFEALPLSLSHVRRVGCVKFNVETKITRLPEGLEKFKHLTIEVPSGPRFATLPDIIGWARVDWRRPGDHCQPEYRYRYFPDKYRRLALERNEVQPNISRPGPVTDEPIPESFGQRLYRKRRVEMDRIHQEDLAQEIEEERAGRGL